MKNLEIIKKYAFAIAAIVMAAGFSAFKMNESKNDSPFYPMENNEYQSTPLELSEEGSAWSCEPGEICAAQFSSPPTPLNQTPDGEIKVGKFVRH